MATAVHSSECTPLFPYTPSPILAIIAICLYSGLSVSHIVRMFTTRTWDNMFMVVGGICEIMGFAARLWSSTDVCNKAPFGIQSVLLVLGPTLMMFTVTLTQTVFIRTLQASRFVWVPIGLQQRLYLSINILLAILQTAGTSISTISSDMSLIITASKVLIASFIVQIFFWLFLLAENIYFSFKLGRSLKTSGAENDHFAISSGAFVHWKRWNQLFGLAIAIIGTGRNLVRLTATGGVEFLLVNEWPSYAFDFYQMVVVMGAWAIWYLPGKCKMVLTKI